uniref:ribosomal protein L32 n=1 Tax=Phacellanthus tubiflorus TaxID=2028290 RepID=UPI002238387C|nr:ribosomal protein L32 [Phacellanthus tubiflorus]UYR95063.1 ribosomal protein L32 [Phacellanthus tubiflorus]
MAVPKKRTSSTKKCIRKNFWKKKGYWAALKAFSLGKALYNENSNGKHKKFYATTNKISNKR